MNVGGRSAMARILGDDDLDVVGADAGGHHRHAQALMRAGHRVELAVATMDLDVLEHLRDAVGPIGIARQQDVIGDLSGREVDVVLAVGVGQRDQRIRFGHGASFCPTSASARAARNDSHVRACVQAVLARSAHAQPGIPRGSTPQGRSGVAT